MVPATAIAWSISAGSLLSAAASRSAMVASARLRSQSLVMVSATGTARPMSAGSLGSAAVNLSRRRTSAMVLPQPGNATASATAIACSIRAAARAGSITVSRPAIPASAPLRSPSPGIVPATAIAWSISAGSLAPAAASHSAIRVSARLRFWSELWSSGMLSAAARALLIIIGSGERRPTAARR